MYQNLSFLDFILFYNSKNRHLEFLNLSPQGLISSNQYQHFISFSECAVTITQPFGVITSPGFPQLYRNSIDCTWNIQLSIGQLIQFNFLHFHVQSHPSCT